MGAQTRKYNANRASTRKILLCDFPLFSVLRGGAETAHRRRVTFDGKPFRNRFFETVFC